MSGQKKKFVDCDHRGFGQYCHRCKPWPEQTSEQRLTALNKSLFPAKKERAKLAEKIKERKDAKSKNHKLRNKQDGRTNSSRPKGKRGKNPKHTSAQGGKFKKR